MNSLKKNKQLVFISQDFFKEVFNEHLLDFENKHLEGSVIKFKR
jgi:hypothetical protein